MAAAGSGGEEEFDEREMEVAAILADLPSLVLARAGLRRRRQQKTPPRLEIPSWGRRRSRTAHPAAAAVEEKPAAVVAAADSAAGEDRGEGAASPDTPLAFPEQDVDDEEAPAEEEKETKERAHKEWVQEQRGVLASLSSLNAHLSKQIEEFKARLLASKSTNDSLKQMQQQQQQTKQHKKRNRPEEEEEGERRRQRTAAGDRPALDLNEPAAAEEAEDGSKPQPQWRQRGQQEQELQKAAQSAAARRRRQDIRRAKAAAAGRTRGRRG